MKHNLVLIAALSLALGGCGSSSNNTSPDSVTPTAVDNSGQAVDGYLNGAQAFYDANNNGLLDAGEPSAITDNEGKYSITTTGYQPITVIGGVNTDTGLVNSGLLKAPAGSKFVTPLTTLIASGAVTAAQLQSNLRLASDVTQTNPMTNPDLHARTLAVQQIVQETADTLAALGGNSTQAVREQLYGLAAKELAKALAANGPVTLTNTAAVATLTNATLQTTMKSAADSGAIDGGIKTALQALKPESVAALTAPIIAGHASTVADPATATDPNKVKATQSLVFASGMAVLLQSYLGAASNPDSFAAIASEITKPGASPSSIATTVNSTLGTGFLETDINGAYGLKHYLAISNDQVQVNGSPYTLAQFEGGGVPPVRGPFTNIQFRVDVKGDPLPLNTPTEVSLGLEVSSPTDSRRLEMIIDKAVIRMTTDSNGGRIIQQVSVPTGANLYVFGRNSKGVEANAELPNSGVNVIDSNCSCFTWNPNQALLKVATELGNNPVFSELQNTTGSFKVTMNISNVRVARQDASGKMVLANPYTIAVRQAGSGKIQQSVFGYGASGKLTIQ